MDLCTKAIIGALYYSQYILSAGMYFDCVPKTYFKWLSY